MSDRTEISRLFSSFEDCKFDFEGTEAWRARDLMQLLGYAEWRNFREVISKAWDSCLESGGEPKVNFRTAVGDWAPGEVFVDGNKNPKGGRPSEDVILTRRAAYLVAMNGNPRKAAVAFSQHYFAVKTRTLEVIEQRLAEATRIEAREQLSTTERKFQGVLYEHDVDGPGISRIRSRGDSVLFGGNDTEDMKSRWGVPKGRPLADFAPEVAIVAKQLAAAMTTHNVRANHLKGEAVINGEHVANNDSVRSGLIDRGIVLEQLDGEEDIKKVQRRHASETKTFANEPKTKKRRGGKA